MNELDYTKGVPATPPDGLISFLYSQGVFNDEYLVYKTEYVSEPLTGIKERAIEVKCSSCNETFYQDYIKESGSCGNYSHYNAGIGFINSATGDAIYDAEWTLCPNCAAEVRAIHSSNIRNVRTVNEIYPITIDVINGRLTVCSWFVKRNINKNARTSIITLPYEAYILDGRKMIKLCGYEPSMFNTALTGKWEQRKRCTDTFGEHLSKLTLPFNADILNGTDAENCKLDIYLNSSENTFPITYLRIWQRHHNVENLIMQGAGNIVTELISRHNPVQPRAYSSAVQGIDWKKKRPHEMLGLTKTEFKTAVKEKWDIKTIEFYTKAKKYGVCIENIGLCRERGLRNVKTLFVIENDVIKSLRYLDKQKKKYPKNKNEIDENLLKDYWEMAKKLGENVADNNIKYPQNLVGAHNSVLMRMEFEEKKELREKFGERYEALKRFSYSYKGLEIRPARSENELIKEGRILRHCVATYAKSHASGNTAILFIRKSKEPDEPFFTLEFDEKTLGVRQNRGLRNCSRTAEVKEFEEKWLEHIKRMKGENDNGESNGSTSERKSA